MFSGRLVWLHWGGPARAAEWDSVSKKISLKIFSKFPLVSWLLISFSVFRIPREVCQTLWLLTLSLQCFECPRIGVSCYVSWLVLQWSAKSAKTHSVPSVLCPFWNLQLLVLGYLFSPVTIWFCSIWGSVVSWTSHFVVTSLCINRWSQNVLLPSPSQPYLFRSGNEIQSLTYWKLSIVAELRSLVPLFSHLE